MSNSAVSLQNLVKPFSETTWPLTKEKEMKKAPRKPNYNPHLYINPSAQAKKSEEKDVQVSSDAIKKTFTQQKLASNSLVTAHHIPPPKFIFSSSVTPTCHTTKWKKSPTQTFDFYL